MLPPRHRPGQVAPVGCSGAPPDRRPAQARCAAVGDLRRPGDQEEAGGQVHVRRRSWSRSSSRGRSRRGSGRSAGAGDVLETLDLDLLPRVVGEREHRLDQLVDRRLPADVAGRKRGEQRSRVRVGLIAPAASAWPSVDPAGHVKPPTEPVQFTKSSDGVRADRADRARPRARGADVDRAAARIEPAGDRAGRPIEPAGIEPAGRRAELRRRSRGRSAVFVAG